LTFQIQGAESLLPLTGFWKALDGGEREALLDRQLAAEENPRGTPHFGALGRGVHHVTCNSNAEIEP